jgi:hypothetical protein
MEQGTKNEQQEKVNGEQEKVSQKEKTDLKQKSETKIRYDVVRPHIKNGDVLMFKGKYRSSFLIKWLTKSSYSHAGIAVWWNKRLMVMETVEEGVRIIPLSRKIDSYRGNVEWFTCNRKISKRDRLKMVISAQEELGKSYAKWKTIVFGWKIFFKRKLSEKDDLRRENKLFCSQYVAQVYNSVGLDLRKDRADRFMSPDDIANSPLLEKKGVFFIRKRIFLQLKEGTQFEIE